MGFSFSGLWDLFTISSFHRFLMPDPGYPVKNLPVLQKPGQNHIKRRRDRLMRCNRVKMEEEI